METEVESTRELIKRMNAGFCRECNRFLEFNGRGDDVNLICGDCHESA